MKLSLVAEKGWELRGYKLTSEFLRTKRESAFPSEKLAHYNVFGFQSIETAVAGFTVLDWFSIKEPSPKAEDANHWIAAGWFDTVLVEIKRKNFSQRDCWPCFVRHG